MDRFEYNVNARNLIRSQNEIQGDAIVFLYVGRLSRDKGLLDLLGAFSRIAEQNTDVHLMIVGPDEEGLEMEVASCSSLFPGRVHRIGFVDRPEDFMAAADVFCLPSYREGFGMVIIEAAAVGIPAIASRIYGITDAVEDGVTGILHAPASCREIAEAMRTLINDQKLRKTMGEAARKRVVEKFSQERVTKAFTEFYNQNFCAIEK